MFVKIGIIGLGFVGGSMDKSFRKKIGEMGLNNIEIIKYDKYKDGGIGTFEECLNTDILFLALPTLYHHKTKSYDHQPIKDTCYLLEQNNYNGTIVIKSTIEPTITDMLSDMYKTLHFIHNPEFLTARTAYEDFHNQDHIVLGQGKNCPDHKVEIVKKVYQLLYPTAKISICKSIESESMKIFCNTFYAVKLQYFNELYLLCKKLNVDYDNVVQLMLKNNWINPMHTTVPGPDGQLSYGGLCFPKDTNALMQFMKKNNVPCAVLESTIEERNKFRKDHDNCE